MSYTQQRLAAWQVESIRDSIKGIRQFNWQCTAEGHEYWQSVIEKLECMERNATTDGHPWVKQQRWIVPTDEDAKRRPKCRVRDYEGCEWANGTLLGVGSTDHPYNFACCDNDGFIEVFKYCEILAE